MYVTSDSWLMVDGQPKQVRNLNTFGCTKSKVYEITTKEGHTLYATENMLVKNKSLDLYFNTKAPLLKIGDKISLIDGNDDGWLGDGTYEEGYIVGWLFGDGTILKKYPNEMALLLFEDEHCLVNKILSFFTDEVSCNFDPVKKCFILKSQELISLRERFGFDAYKLITTEIEMASSDFQAGFISGFIDADGSMDSSRLRIRLAQANKQRIFALQRMLLRFGIYSNIDKIKYSPTGIVLGRKVYLKQAYSLRISNKDVLKYVDLVKVQHPNKMITLNGNITDHYKYNKIEKQFATIVSIKQKQGQTVFNVNCNNCDGFIIK